LNPFVVANDEDNVLQLYPEKELEASENCKSMATMANERSMEFRAKK
jgi:hypothetical protein